jgi:hypothetical protein
MDEMAYPPMNDPKGEIRIVRLYSKISSQNRATTKTSPSRPPQALIPVYCELFVARRIDDPPYEALSYTWGDAADKVPILVNDKVLEVTRNLFLALANIRMENADSFLWIDAICINQKDGQEKGIQVGSMRETYAKASATLSWLGPSTDDSDRVLNEFERMGTYLIETGILDLMINLRSLARDETERHEALNKELKIALSHRLQQAWDKISETYLFLKAAQGLMS